MTPITNHTKWLESSADYWKISTDQLLSCRKSFNNYVIHARLTYYWLCIKDGIDIYELSKFHGKHRTTLLCTLNNTKLDVKQHVANILNKLKNKPMSLLEEMDAD